MCAMQYNLAKDRFFILALLGAVIFWLWLYLATQPELNLAWPFAAPLTFMLLALLYPLLEEIVFRGMLQVWLLAYLPYSRHGISLANLVTSLVFTGLHFLQHPPLWALGVFVPSVLFGFFRDRYNSVIPAILLHCFYNSGYFWLFYKGAITS